MINVLENKWNFSNSERIEDSNFNKVLERFINLGIAGLTRENIQNSLDGRDLDKEDPVIVEIKLDQMKKETIPGIDEIIERINSLEGRNGYTKETIAHMQASVNKELVNYISFEDSNTKGLTGARHGQSNNKDHTWGIYAYNKGVHFEEDDEDFEASRGGSHGVGKIASNAASDLHMMFFANCDINSEKHLGGTIQLIEHQFKNRFYRSTGYFTKLEGTTFMPFENSYDNVFTKNSRGLKIVIPFLRDSFNKEDEVVCAVCDSFFVSILQRQLIVYVNGLRIDEKTIVEIVNNPQYYEQKIEAMKKVYTPLYVNTYTNNLPQTIVVPHQNTEFTFKLYFNYDESIPKGRVGIIRTIGMKIEDFIVKNNATKPFNAVLIGGVNEDNYLKSLENESHTKISSDDIKDPKLKKIARTFINNLSKEIFKVIEVAILSNNPVDGKIDTSNLLYTTEIDFKENIIQTFGTVKVKSGKEIIISDLDGELKGKKGDEKKGKGKGRRPRKESTVRKKEHQVNSGEDINANLDMTEEYKISSHRVERVVIENQEFIQLNLKNSEEVGKAKRCNLKFLIVDGMGKEYSNEFNLEDNYLAAIDMNTQQPCRIMKDGIKNISITNGVVSLKLSLQSRYNRALKFIYCIEV